jgi:hypothetical protein
VVLVVAFAAGVLLAGAGLPSELATAILFSVLFLGIGALGRLFAVAPPRPGERPVRRASGR